MKLHKIPKHELKKTMEEGGYVSPQKPLKVRILKEIEALYIKETPTVKPVAPCVWIGRLVFLSLAAGMTTLLLKRKEHNIQSNIELLPILPIVVFTGLLLFYILISLNRRHKKSLIV